MASHAASALNNRIVLSQVGLFVLGVFSVMILASFGGQLVVAPALLPAQWHIARRTSGLTSGVFSLLGATLTAEIVWISLGLLASWSGSSLVGVLVALLGTLAGVFFFKSSRPGNKN